MELGVFGGDLSRCTSISRAIFWKRLLEFKERGARVLGAPSEKHIKVSERPDGTPGSNIRVPAVSPPEGQSALETRKLNAEVAGEPERTVKYTLEEEKGLTELAGGDQGPDSLR